MNIYYEAILQASEYIEENLTQDIKVQDIIQNVGFSQYHFMRLFKAISGHTISNYIKRRKMTEASKLLLTTDMRILDIAVLFGYNSQEAFTRAFKEVYNVTPNTYRANNTRYRNIEQIVINENILNLKASAVDPMEPRIVRRDGFLIAGLKYRGSNQNFEVPKLWNQLSEKVKTIKNKIIGDHCYGYESYDDDFDRTGSFVYMVGIELSSITALPEDFEYQKVNSSKYAVFPISAVVENMPKSIIEIYTVHLPASGLKAARNYDFEYYDYSFEVNNMNSFISFYVPIE
jgi:AraC family transcriptional regulator